MQSWLTKSMGSYTFASCTRSLGTFTWTPFVNDRMSRRVGMLIPADRLLAYAIPRQGLSADDTRSVTMRTRREFIVLLGGAAAVRRSSAQDRPARILYFTHSAGYRHDVIPTSRDVLQRIGATADFQITMSEDVAVFTTENLLRYGGIMFFTTGELPMSNAQRARTHGLHSGGRRVSRRALGD